MQPTRAIIGAPWHGKCAGCGLEATYGNQDDAYASGWSFEPYFGRPPQWCPACKLKTSSPMLTYPSRLDTISLGRWGSIRFNQWMFNETPIAFSEATVDRVAQFVPPGSFAVDIGAYTGDTTIPIALATGPRGHVLAFEPGPAAFRRLLENLALNALSQVAAYPAAITAVPGLYTFHYVDEGYINGGFSLATAAGPKGCGNSFDHTVEGVSLSDRLLSSYSRWLPRWSYLKIDTEGYDKEILKANAPLLRQYHPVIELEVYPFLNDEERADLKSAITALDYRWEGDESQFHQPSPTVVNVICRPL